MFVRLLATAVAVLMVNLVLVSSSNAQKKDLSREEAKTQISTLGTGPKALVRVTLRDKKKVQGWISLVADDQFTVTDKTGTTTSITYAEVSTLKSLKPSKGLTAAVAVVAIGVAALVFLFAGAKH